MQDVGKVSMTKADYNTEDDYFSFSDISSSESSRPLQGLHKVNDTNKNQSEILQFLKEKNEMRPGHFE